MIRNLLYALFLHLFIVTLYLLKDFSTKSEPIALNKVTISLQKEVKKENIAPAKPAENSISKKASGKSSAQPIATTPKTSIKKPEIGKEAPTKMAALETKSITTTSIQQKAPEPSPLNPKLAEETKNKVVEKKVEQEEKPKQIEKTNSAKLEQQEMAKIIEEVASTDMAQEAIQKDENKAKNDKQIAIPSSHDSYGANDSTIENNSDGTIELAGSAEAPSSDNLTRREKLNIQSQLNHCYRMANSQNPVSKKIKVVIQIHIKEDGYIDDDIDKLVDKKRYANDVNYRKIIENLHQTVIFCSPMRNMPKNKYDSWKDVLLEFKE